MTNLYTVRSKINIFNGEVFLYDSEVDWFVSDRKNPVVPYDQAIRDYRRDKENLHRYPEGTIDELFTEEEANAFKNYLQTFHGVSCQITEKKLPIPFNTISCGGIPVGGETQRYYLDEEKEYDLPFKVNGLYKLQHRVYLKSNPEVLHELNE